MHFRPNLSIYQAAGGAWLVPNCNAMPPKRTYITAEPETEMLTQVQAARQVRGSEQGKRLAQPTKQRKERREGRARQR